MEYIIQTVLFREEKLNLYWAIITQKYLLTFHMYAKQRDQIHFTVKCCWYLRIIVNNKIDANLRSG